MTLTVNWTISGCHRVDDPLATGTASSTGRTLLNAGVDPHAKDDPGQLPVDLARANDCGQRGPQPLTTGRAFTGRIESTDGVRWSLAYYEQWEISATSGQRVVITMESEDFDPYLIVLSGDGTEIASDDDGGDGHNARVEFRAPATGRYTILATTAAEGETGRYGIRLDANGDRRQGMSSSQSTPTNEHVRDREQAR